MNASSWRSSRHRGDKFLIADLSSARQCGYKATEHTYRVDNTSHSGIKVASMRMTALARHNAPAHLVPMSTGGWISMRRLMEYMDYPPWFLVEIMRANVKARFSSCQVAMQR